MNWFSFTGTNPLSPAHYTLVATQPTCPGLPQRMCALQAQNDGSNNPDMTDELKEEIANCLENKVNSTNVKLKA
ncbi:hypothetical protein ABE426_19190 [Sphingobacterium faecium]|uniref:hypothetical protein n=1 Tax=Sphingobacterium faecium TaxID=34087 RepID=UPI003207A7B3